ncbi:hypothetical protein LSH36_106g00055 [Paralvinella palmiformis]|uniref:Uncharacterized protein n=1 Tax=Paralvinella palmiformis TaxID=53620 RepID=A0AAD9NCB7_9ANNE|nr:hypothetical protein LSH36_106g00055 [Paralvinella palmiformis]
MFTTAGTIDTSVIMFTF